MLLVLACAVFLLFVVPRMLLGLGRLIERATDGRRREADVHGGGAEQAAWFRRPMRPAFGGPRRQGGLALRR